MDNATRDILHAVWLAAREHRAYARRIKAAICEWGGCDDCVVEEAGSIWVSGPEPGHLTSYEAHDLVQYLRGEALITEGPVQL